MCGLTIKVSPWDKISSTVAVASYARWCICGLHGRGERTLELRLDDRMESYTALADGRIMFKKFIGCLYSLAG